MPATLDLDVHELIDLAYALPLAPKRVDQAAARAINKATDRGFTALRRSLVQTTGLKSSDVGRSKGLTVTKANANRLVSEVVARSRWTPLSYFAPGQRRKGVSARAWGVRRIYPGTFLATMQSGHQGVWQRVQEGTRPRLRGNKAGAKKGDPRPIWGLRELWGPSLAVEMMREPNPTIFRSRVSETLPGYLEHELGRSLAGLKQMGIPGQDDG